MAAKQFLQNGAGGGLDATFQQVTAADIAAIANNTVLANISGGSAAPAADTLTAILDAVFSSTQGSVLFRSTSVWQALGPGTTGQVLTSGGPAADVSWTTPAAPNFKLLNTLTASNSATLSDTTSLTSTYSAYDIIFENLLPVTNNTTLEFQVHSGGTFQTTSYLSTTLWVGAATNVVNTTGFIQCSATALVLNTGAGASGSLRIYTPSGTSAPKMVVGSSGHRNSTPLVNAATFSGSWDGGNGAVDGFQILFNSGNISSGTVKIYGIT